MGPRVLLAIVRRPSLWVTALVQGVRLVPGGWWRRWPFLPVPDRAYLRFRLETQYGGAGDHPAEPGDVVTWLAWCKQFDRQLGKTRRPRSGRTK